MNINEIIEKVFKDFTFDDLEIPIAPNLYEGSATTYLVYTTNYTKPINFGDDKPIFEEVDGTINLYTNKNYKKLKNEIKRKIVEECGFTWTGDEYEDYESDTKLWHIPINFVTTSEVAFLND